MCPSQPTPLPEAERPPKAKMIENIVLIVCILPLWTIILGYQNIWFTLLHAVCVVILAVILVRRIRRLRAAIQERQKQNRMF